MTFGLISWSLPPNALIGGSVTHVLMSLMIIWDFNVIVALGITLSLGIVIVLWVFYTLSGCRADPLSNREFFRQCSFCGYLYFDYFKKVLGACPRCGSYQDVSSAQKA